MSYHNLKIIEEGSSASYYYQLLQEARNGERTNNELKNIEEQCNSILSQYDNFTTWQKTKSIWNGNSRLVGITKEILNEMDALYTKRDEVDKAIILANLSVSTLKFQMRPELAKDRIFLKKFLDAALLSARCDAIVEMATFNGVTNINGDVFDHNFDQKLRKTLYQMKKANEQNEIVREKYKNLTRRLDNIKLSKLQ